MWKNYIEIIEQRNANYTIKEYCHWFANKFFLELQPLDNFLYSLEKENGEILPIIKNISDSFHDANLNFMINFIYHLNDLENIDFLIMDDFDTLNYDKMFTDKNSSTYFFKLFSLDNESLLNNNDNNNTLLYLFFYFFPKKYQTDILTHYYKKIPLISCNKVTFYHFEMLLFLMKTFEKNKFQQFCEGYNLSLILVEDFCQNTSEIYNNIEDNHDWFDILPTDKIKTLFLSGCELKNFMKFRNEKIYYTLPTLEVFINYLQKDLEYNILKEKLDNKAKNKKVIKTKCVKI